AWSFLGRLAQVAQCAVLLRAVGGAGTISGGFIGEGIHLVGAGIGDLVPGQLGTNEGAYSAFAGALGLADAPASAVSLALLPRIAQLALTAFALAVAALVPREIKGKTGAAAESGA